MTRKTFYIPNQSSLRPQMVAAWAFVCDVIQGGAIEVIVSRVSKTRAQEKRYHAMIRDLSQHVEVNSNKLDPIAWKSVLVEQFGHELASSGTPLAKPGRQIMSFDGCRVVQIRPSSSDFRAGEASDFIEYLYSVGAEYNVTWSDPEEQAKYRDYWERIQHENM